MLEDRSAQHDKVIVDKFHNPYADYEMTTRDYVLRPYTVDEAITITLPPVTEAKGRIYSIVVGAATGAFTVTIQDRDESEDWIADIVLSEKGQGVFAYSDGRHWTFVPVGIRAASFSTSRIDAVSQIRTDTINLVTTVASTVNQLEAMRVTLFADVQAGEWANAICAVVDLETSGFVQGLVGVVCAELDMPGSAACGANGTYSCYEAEINMPTSFTGGGVPVTFFSLNLWGAEKAQFDTSGLLFDITGVTVASGKFFQENTATAATHALRCRIAGTLYYVMLTSADA